MIYFSDRKEAGRELARSLYSYRCKEKTLVLGLSRCGVPVAFEVAKALNLPLDVLPVHTFHVPGHEGVAMGAITREGIFIARQDIIDSFHIPKSVLNGFISEEKKELKRRDKMYRHGKPFPVVAHKTVILVDDGIATGMNMRAAVEMIRKKNPEKVVVATPVAHAAACASMVEVADEVVCLHTPQDFQDISVFYDDFSQITDEEILELLMLDSSGASDAKEIGECACERA